MENNKDENDDTEDLKGKMKRNKFMKKLKKNEKECGNFNQHHWQYLSYDFVIL